MSCSDSEVDVKSRLYADIMMVLVMGSQVHASTSHATVVEREQGKQALLELLTDFCAWIVDAEYAPLNAIDMGRAIYEYVTWVEENES